MPIISSDLRSQCAELKAAKDETVGVDHLFQHWMFRYAYYTYNEGCRCVCYPCRPPLSLLSYPVMASQIGPLVPDLTDADRAYIFTELDSALNSRILYSLLLGLYTGIVAVTLESICEQGSIVSSLHSGTHLGGWRSQQGSDELEAQLEGGDEYLVAAASTAYSDDDVTHREHCKTQSEGLDNTAASIVPRD
ncbi:hypothetical protein EDD85DRAFT_860425 [Armillaria nabsnona]|nr:hypothetical protein EDD85DRAFT_860425 [Armillaria nabsnona]